DNDLQEKQPSLDIYCHIVKGNHCKAIKNLKELKLFKYENTQQSRSPDGRDSFAEQR
ncbi:hypothetical protein C0J52_04613, partial [Blattella germanica]